MMIRETTMWLWINLYLLALFGLGLFIAFHSSLVTGHWSLPQ